MGAREATGHSSRPPISSPPLLSGTGGCTADQEGGREVAGCSLRPPLPVPSLPRGFRVRSDIFCCLSVDLNTTRRSETS